jgi:hypothetical protein
VFSLCIPTAGRSHRATTFGRPQKRVNLQSVDFKTTAHQQTAFLVILFLAHTQLPLYNITSKSNLLEGTKKTIGNWSLQTSCNRKIQGLEGACGTSLENNGLVKLPKITVPVRALLSLARQPPLVPLEHRSQVLLALGESHITCCCATPALAS